MVMAVNADVDQCALHRARGPDGADHGVRLLFQHGGDIVERRHGLDLPVLRNAHRLDHATVRSKMMTKGGVAAP
jgi:hypothetical protein